MRFILLLLSCWVGFPGSSNGKESACNTGHPGLIPGSGRSSEEGNGYPFQYFCLENSMARGALQATVHGVAKSWTWLKRLSTAQHTRWKKVTINASKMHLQVKLGLHSVQLTVFPRVVASLVTLTWHRSLEIRALWLFTFMHWMRKW